MRSALAYLDEPHARPLYSEVFFRRGIKFQYAPTSLLLLEPLRRIPGLTSDAFLNGLSWFAVAGTAILTAWILSLGLARAGLDGDSGFRSRLYLRSELADARARLASLEAEIGALRSEAEKLEGDDYALERAIREELELVRPGQTLIRLRRRGVPSARIP